MNTNNHDTLLVFTIEAMGDSEAHEKALDMVDDGAFSNAQYLTYLPGRFAIGRPLQAFALA